MKTLFQIFLLSILALTAQAETLRRVANNVLISNSLPAIRIEIDKKFRFIGSFPFRLGNVAEGERFVFVDANGRNVERMFIAQFEGFLPENTEIYHYNFDNARSIGGFKFRQNTFAFSFAEDIKQNSQAESAFTKKFLDEKKYQISDEWMMSRFLTLGDETRRHELILFYMEPVARTEHKLSEFYEGDSSTPLWDQISKELTARSYSAFKIHEL